MLLISQAKFLNELLEKMPEIEIINFLWFKIRHRKISVYYKKIMLNVQKFEILIRFVSVSIKSTLGISRHIPSNMDNRANSLYVQSVWSIWNFSRPMLSILKNVKKLHRLGIKYILIRKLIFWIKQHHPF